MTNQASTTKKFTWSEIAKHNQPSMQTLWVVVHGEVYDVTKFQEDHPGGAEIFAQHGGRDATKTFDKVGHSMDARELMTQYKIGEIEPEESKRCAVQ